MDCRILFLIFIISHCNGMDLPLKQPENRKPYSQQIIFLNGTTTAGKSSIVPPLVKALEAQQLSVKVLSIDSFVVPKVGWTLFTERINPYNICVANEDLFKKSHIKQIKNESIRELCAAAISAYKQNSIVIIDAPIYKLKHIAFYKNEFYRFGISNVSWMLVYCPVTTLIKRVIDRNNKSSMMEQRSITQALYQFSNLYQSQEQNVIDQLSESKFEKMCSRANKEHKITQEMIPGLLKGVQKAVCPYEFGVIKHLMLDKILFDSDNVAPISPTISHDFIVNTGKYDSATCAYMILDFLTKNN